jgi:CheY-like chemotaxis protein
MATLTRILHVEDEPDIREIAAIGLGEIAGYTVLGCATADEALSAVSREPQPDLLLLDVMMPDRDGTDLLADLRAVPGMTDVPAVFVTAKTDPDEIAPLKAAGAVDVVTKPFDPMTLGETVQRIWDEHVG